MTPAAFGVIIAAVEAIDADLNPQRLDNLDAEDLAGLWHQAAALCRAADGLYDKLRRAYAHEKTMKERT